MYDRIESENSRGTESMPTLDKLLPSPNTTQQQHAELIAQSSTRHRQLQAQLTQSRANERKLDQELSRTRKLVEERDLIIDKLFQTN